MKKQLKIPAIIISIIAAVFVIALLVYAIFFPGYPSYKVIKEYCRNIDIVSEPYPYYGTEIPEDLTVIGASGITMKIPSDIQLSDIDDEYVVYNDGSENGRGIVIQKAQTYEKAAYENMIVKGRTWAEFVDTIPDDTPDTYYSFLKAQYSISMDSLNIRKKTDAQVIASLACLKEANVTADTKIYEYETENAVGFIYQRPQGEYTAELFSRSDLNKSHVVTIVSDDEETAKQIIASIELTEG